MYKTTVPIKGMHCRSCELLIEDELSEIKGVQSVRVSHSQGCAVMYHEASSINFHKIESAVNRAGYEIGAAEKKPWINLSPAIAMDIFYSLLAVGVLYFLFTMFGLDKAFAANPGKPTNLLAVVLIGLTAGFSTCMALVGGLVLGVSARFSEEHPTASNIRRFRPHLFFNIGRIGSYALFGGLIGLLGSIFQLSGMMLGILTIGAAAVMFLLGLQLTGLFPSLEDFKLTLPVGLSRILGISTKASDSYSDKQAMIMGATTFFLPCGFTQAMQLYAMSTGNFAAGAMTMAAFALGTAPGLLGIGGLTSVLKGVYAQKFFRFASVVVILLAVFNFNNGLNLTGLNPSFPNIPSPVKSAETFKIEREGDKQVIRMDQVSSGYRPNTLKVVKGIPVKWIVTSKDPYSCAASLLASKIGVRANLEEGENVFEFTPTEAGKIPFSCMMGMFRGTIEVVESEQELSNKPAVPQAAAAEAQDTGSNAGSCGSGGCGCGSVTQKAQATANDTPTAAATENGIQVLETTYIAQDDISPNRFEVKAGQPVRLEIDVKDDGVGCMSSIMIPGYTKPKLLTAGEQLVLEFTPKEKGELLITCSMGMPRGSIKVI